jgi:hypothetical protein
MKTRMLVLSLLLAGCSTGTTDPSGDSGAQVQVDVGNTVDLKLGETAAVRGTAVTVKFSSVESDSRCPINAVCVWQGDAHIRLQLANERGPLRQADVHTGLDPKSVEFAGITVTLREVAPSRLTTEPVPPRDYHVKLEITR